MSVIVIVPVRCPCIVGANVTLIVQLGPMATVAPHVLVCKKSPLIAMLVIVRVSVPLLVSITVWAGLVVPITWSPKVRLVGVSVTAGAVPVPLSAIVWGLLSRLKRLRC